MAEWLAYLVVTCETWAQSQAPPIRPICKWVQKFRGRLRRSRQAADHSSSFSAFTAPLGVLSHLWEEEEESDWLSYK